MPGVKARHVAAAVHNTYIALERLVVEADVYIVHRVRGDGDRLKEEEVGARCYWTSESTAGQGQGC
jgi:hypothetical protein